MGPDGSRPPLPPKAGGVSAGTEVRRGTTPCTNYNARPATPSCRCLRLRRAGLAAAARQREHDGLTRSDRDPITGRVGDVCPADAFILSLFRRVDDRAPVGGNKVA